MDLHSLPAGITTNNFHAYLDNILLQFTMDPFWSSTATVKVYDLRDAEEDNRITQSDFNAHFGDSIGDPLLFAGNYPTEREEPLPH